MRPTSGLCLSILVLGASCTGVVTGPEKTVILSVEQGRVRIMALQPELTPTRPPDGPLALRYELLDLEGRLVAAGTVADPRRQRLEMFDEEELKQIEAPRPGIVSIRLPATAGDLVLLEQRLGVWQEVGRADFDPHARWTQLAKEADILGPPVRVAGGGDPTRSANIVVMPEGYTQQEMDRFHGDVDDLADRFRKQPDYEAHWDQIVIWRIDVRSAESGIDDPQRGITRETAFDVSFGYGTDQDPRRLAYPRTAQGKALASQVADGVAGSTAVLLINTDERTGSGGEVVTISRESRWFGLVKRGAEILAHELGHSLVGLADEYDNGSCPWPPRTAPNISTSCERDSLPWKDLVDPGTSLPTTSSLFGGKPVGAYQGGAYCRAGVWRPEPDCLMRHLGQRMCAVCRREMDRRFAQLGGILTE